MTNRGNTKDNIKKRVNREVRSSSWARQQEHQKRWLSRNRGRVRALKRTYYTRSKTRGPVVVGGGPGLNLSSVEWEPALHIESKEIAVTSDYHIPFVDEEWLRRLVDEANERGITDLAVIGDFWDCDSISIYATNGKKFALADEIIEVNKVLRFLEGQFKRFWFSTGNHEYRWARLHAELNTNMLWKNCELPKGAVTSRNDHMILNGNWRLVHPHNYRQQGGSVAQAIAMKHKMNIVNTHGHFAWGPELDTMSKSYWLMDLGGLFDPKKIEYMQRSSTFPMLNRGFGFIIDGEPELIKEHL
jgi:hypothetical protein